MFFRLYKDDVCFCGFFVGFSEETVAINEEIISCGNCHQVSREDFMLILPFALFVLSQVVQESTVRRKSDHLSQKLLMHLTHFFEDV